MKKQILFFSLIIFAQLSCLSQIVFEKGYFVDEANQKIECFIKNVDWKNNPDGFEYKLSEDGESKEAGINDVKEFSITGSSKFIRAKVNIDRSSNELYKMSRHRNPDFQEEVLFLKVLIEGKGVLLNYVDQNVERFFYKTDEHEIEQLVFKRYIDLNDQVQHNNQFRQQLLKDVNCQDIPMTTIQAIEYNKRELERYFIKYNECKNSEYITYERKIKHDIFNLSLKPGVNISRLLIINTQSKSSAREFDSEVGFRMGIEAEFILPFNKNKWGLIIEPAYQSYKSEKDLTKVNYESIEIPFGIRYYMFLGKNSKLFINAAYVFDINSKNSLVDYDDRTDVIIDSFGNFAFGAGYKFYRFSSEIRYYANRELFNGYVDWFSEYNSFSIVFGITLF